MGSKATCRVSRRCADGAGRRKAKVCVICGRATGEQSRAYADGVADATARALAITRSIAEKSRTNGTAVTTAPTTATIGAVATTAERRSTGRGVDKAHGRKRAVPFITVSAPLKREDAGRFIAAQVAKSPTDFVARGKETVATSLSSG